MRVHRLTGVLALGLTAACAAHIASTPVPAPAAGSHIRYAVRSDSARFTTARVVSLDAGTLISRRFDPGIGGRPGRWIAESLATDALAHLQVRTGRRGHALRGGLIGAGVGLASGLLCAAAPSDGWLQPDPGECLAFSLLGGAGYGLLIGALIKSDVWSPVILPLEPAGPPPQFPPVTAGRTAFGLRLPLRLNDGP
jgi:hypothetical protein